MKVKKRVKLHKNETLLVSKCAHISGMHFDNEEKTPVAEALTKIEDGRWVGINIPLPYQTAICNMCGSELILVWKLRKPGKPNVNTKGKINAELPEKAAKW